MRPQHLFLVRHGQTDGNVSQVLRGPAHHADPLDAPGTRQAAAVARHLHGRGLAGTPVYVSTYRRAQQTGEAIAAALGSTIRSLPGLHEIDPGDWVGRPYRDLGDPARTLLTPDGTLKFPGGESAAQVAERMEAALNTVPDDTAIVVSHGGALTCLFAARLRLSTEDAWFSGRYAHANAAYSELRRQGETWEVLTLARRPDLGGH